MKAIFIIGMIHKRSRTLRPKYISTVDSGNLAGHLLTLRQGLLMLPNQKITGPVFIEGLQDTLRLALDSLPKEEAVIRPSLAKLYETGYTEIYTLPNTAETFSRIY